MVKADKYSPIISIIVPCYKVEKYLPACLDSLFSQTLKDIEVIAINDGSPDNCLKILKEYKKRERERLVIINKINEGTWAGRRDGLKIARGQYIGFLDSDDTAEPTMFEDLYACALVNDADITVCGFRRINEEKNKVISEEFTKARSNFELLSQPERLLELNGAPWNKLFKASIIKKLPQIKHKPRFAEDLIMHLLTYPKTKKIAFCNKALVNYMIRSNSAVSTLRKKDITECYAAMKETKKIYQSQQVNTDLNYVFDASAFLHLGISLMYRISYNPKINLNKAIKENKEFLNKNFPSWNSDKIINRQNAMHYKSALEKIYLARIFYNAHLLKPTLTAYRQMIEKLNIDIKW
ncbi:MAG: glycosyltransferase [Coriobacteriales bacterium]|nr:glycosyltransferase [Coriobacteriales bacterium]